LVFQPSWIVGDSFFFLEQCFQFPNPVLKSVWSGAEEVLMKVPVLSLKQLSSFLSFGEEELCDVFKEEKQAS
jgi:hypothetical protein